ncbi:creatininase family protein [Bacillus salipaludis]|uniref:Creatininase family protein n=1 Tax=Bacillus salipaludis TaxID=2547811 RepID=A0ABW8RHX2_9BACI
MNIHRYKHLEERFLPRLTSTQVRDLPKEDALVILPIGATEQHGPHLPVYTDTILAETVLDEAFQHLSKDANIWTLPAIPFGKSDEHMDRPGTFSFSFDTLRSILLDLSRGVHANGFRKLVLFNGHGGNIDTLKLAARHVRIETGLMVFIINVGGLAIPASIISEEEMFMGIHGGDYETSLLMSSYPEWVQDDKLPKEVPMLADKSKYLRFQKGNFAWTIDDVSVSGILGNAQLATKEKGDALYREHGREVASCLLDILTFEISELIEHLPIQVTEAGSVK